MSMILINDRGFKIKFHFSIEYSHELRLHHVVAASAAQQAAAVPKHASTRASSCFEAVGTA